MPEPTPVGTNAREQIEAEQAAHVSERLEQVTTWLAADRERLARLGEQRDDLKRRLAALGDDPPDLAAALGEQLACVEVLLSVQQETVNLEEAKLALLLELSH